jgi:hypothetical protein
MLVEDSTTQGGIFPSSKNISHGACAYHTISSCSPCKRSSILSISVSTEKKMHKVQEISQYKIK